MSEPSIYSIKELAELGGVSRRTVRYYVRRGLIPPPNGTGRGKHYGQNHLDALVDVRTRQEAGQSLDQILASRDVGAEPVDGESQGAPMAGPAESADATPAGATPRARPAPAQSVWARVRIDDDIEIHVRNPRALDSETAARLTEAVRQVLRETQKETP